MRVNFEGIKKLIGQQIILYCDTEKKAEDLLKRLDGIGCKWVSGHKLTQCSPCLKTVEVGCYAVSSLKHVCYSPQLIYTETGWDFLGSRYKLYEYEVTEDKGSGVELSE